MQTDAQRIGTAMQAARAVVATALAPRAETQDDKRVRLLEEAEERIATIQGQYHRG